MRVFTNQEQAAHPQEDQGEAKQVYKDKHTLLHYKCTNNHVFFSVCVFVCEIVFAILFTLALSLITVAQLTGQSLSNPKFKQHQLTGPYHKV